MKPHVKIDNTINTSVYSKHKHPLELHMHTQHVKLEEKVDSITFQLYDTVEEHRNRNNFYYDSGALRPILDISTRKDAKYIFRIEMDISTKNSLEPPMDTWVPITQYDREFFLGDTFSIIVSGVPMQCWVRASIERSPGVDTIRKVRIAART